ncbi:MAG: HlyD family secretion protein [Verrucomicrobia bacterium]|nr:HlyD family secretion protein [Verrucomicrobiota bacterium]
MPTGESRPSKTVETTDSPAPAPEKPEAATGTASPAPARNKNVEPRRGRGRRKWLILTIGALVLAAIMFWGVPFVRRALSMVSTNDAYVNSHVTFVAPRVAGQVARVLVDDNKRVRNGDLLVELDKEPYRVQVELKQAGLRTAQADLSAAHASVQGTIAQTRAARWKLQRAIEDVNNQVAQLRSKVAALNRAKATLTLAQAEYDRSNRLFQSKVTSQEELDQRREALAVAQAEVNQALEDISQIRVALGLAAQPPPGQDLAQVPSDLDQTFSAVRQAQAEVIQSAAQLGVAPSSYNLTPKEMLEEFYRRDAQGNIDRIYNQLAQDAPAIKQAEAKLLSAQRDLDQAELNLRYCDIVSEIDGVVTRRNVNPGNNVQVGQSLMALRSLREIWVDANFKETQLANLRIGQRVDLRVDMYGKRQMFKGRISGFTMGTGSTLALLPAENATGNFVKVVQRLPVRIDVMDYDADNRPLFVGLSVVVSVHVKEPPTGPDAGRIIQPYAAPGPADAAAPVPQADHHE